MLCLFNLYVHTCAQKKTFWRPEKPFTAVTLSLLNGKKSSTPPKLAMRAIVKSRSHDRTYFTKSYDHGNIKPHNGEGRYAKVCEIVGWLVRVE